MIRFKYDMYAFVRRNCFLLRVTHKFRSTLGKSKLIKQDDRVLIVFYGDQRSIALLHLINEGMRETTHKRLRFLPIILFVDGKCRLNFPFARVEKAAYPLTRITFRRKCTLAERLG